MPLEMVKIVTLWRARFQAGDRQRQVAPEEVAERRLSCPR
jgi:hypothetical protein